MKYSRSVSIRWSLCAAVFLAACGGDGDGPTAPAVNPLEGLAGSWVATSFSFQPIDAPHLGSLDLLAMGGAMRMDIATSGELVLTTTNPGDGPDVDVGTIRVLSDTSLEIRIPGDPPLVLDFTFAGSSLDLSGRTTLDVEDYSGPADLMASFVRG